MAETDFFLVEKNLRGFWLPALSMLMVKMWIFKNMMGCKDTMGFLRILWDEQATLKSGDPWGGVNGVITSCVAMNPVIDPFSSKYQPCLV